MALVELGECPVRRLLTVPARVVVTGIEHVLEGADSPCILGHDAHAAVLVPRHVPLHAGSDLPGRQERPPPQDLRIDKIPKALPAPHDPVPAALPDVAQDLVRGQVGIPVRGVPVPDSAATAMLRVGPPVKPVLDVLPHDNVEGRAAVGVVGVLMEITGEPGPPDRAPLRLLLALNRSPCPGQERGSCNHHPRQPGQSKFHTSPEALHPFCDRWSAHAEAPAPSGRAQRTGMRPGSSYSRRSPVAGIMINDINAWVMDGAQLCKTEKEGRLTLSTRESRSRPRIRRQLSGPSPAGSAVDVPQV